MRHRSFKNLSLSGILIILLCSCNKDKDSSLSTNPSDSTSIKRNDFIFLPRADAKWVIHYQGSQASDSIRGYYWDTAYHFYTTISSAIGDTVINNQTFSIANLVCKQVHKTSKFSTVGRLYFREDTLQKTLFVQTRIGNTVGAGGGAIFSFYPNEDSIVKCYWKWPAGQIQKSDSLKINGVNYPAWYININGKNYFYQGFGIGCIAGPLGFSTATYVSGNGGMPVSLDFIYKSDSFHFDYPQYLPW